MAQCVMMDSDLNIYHSLITEYVDDNIGQHDAMLQKGVFISSDDNEETPDTTDPMVLTNGLTFTNCDYIDGGVTSFGKLIIINMRVAYSGEGSIQISGVPIPKKLNGYTYVPVNTQVPRIVTSSYIETNSNVGTAIISFASAPYAGTAIMLSATYIAN